MSLRMIVGLALKVSIILTLFGFGYFSRFLPTEHLIGVQMGIGLLTAMFALLLSLQLSAGKTCFDTQEQDVTLERFFSILYWLTTVLRPEKPVKYCETT
jgi:hypothetical protein